MDWSTPPNISDPQSPSTPLARGIFAACIACICFSVLFVGLRLIARWAKRIHLAADDYIILGALVCVICQAALSIREVTIGGAGVHADEVFPPRFTEFAKMLIAVQIFFAISLGCIKASICLFYVRIFEMRSFQWAAYTVLGFCCAWCLSAVLVPLLLCRPISANWHPSDGQCGSQNPAFISIAAIDIITDICIMILPLPTIVKLQMPWTARLGLVILFSAGILTMIISALRVYNLSRVDYMDLTYTASDSFIWSIIEPTVALGIACAPMIRSLWGHIFHTIRTGSHSASATLHSTRKSFRKLDNGGNDRDNLELGDVGHRGRDVHAVGGLHGSRNEPGEESDDGQAIKVRTDISVTQDAHML